MFYRRKILLALLETFDGQLSKIRLQKMLLIFSEMQQRNCYEFVPFKYGCFSFSANADLSIMENKGMIKSDEKSWYNITQENYSATLTKEDQQILQFIKTNFGHYSTNDFIRYTYVNYPFFAINSQIAREKLSAEEFKIVQNSRPVRTTTTLFTIGYEGVSLENYLNKLLVYDIKLLCDVRNNPFSMKYGFSKKQLENFCSQLGIKYIHMPEVGIKSSERQNLDSQSDYNHLFDKYKRDVLSKTLESQTQILYLLKKYHRVALTCFEANVCQCHRNHLAEAITKLPDWQYELMHI